MCRVAQGYRGFCGGALGFAEALRTLYCLLRKRKLVWTRCTVLKHRPLRCWNAGDNKSRASPAAMHLLSQSVEVGEQMFANSEHVKIARCAAGIALRDREH